MEGNEMRNIEKVVKYLAEHMDEYTYTEYVQVGQDVFERAQENIFDKKYNECLYEHIRNLYSLYRFLKMGRYC